jgi:histidinol-phosphate aminotransferase
MKLPVRDAVVSSPDYPFAPVTAAHKLDQNEAAQDFPAALKALVLEQLARTDWHRYPDLHAETLAADIAHLSAGPRTAPWSPPAATC